LPLADKAWPSDSELVSAILGGSRKHFDLLYETYFPRVYRFALKRLGDPAGTVTEKDALYPAFDDKSARAGHERLRNGVFTALGLLERL